MFDTPTSRTPHEWEDLSGHLEHTDQVDPKNTLPFLGVELLKRLVATEIYGIVEKGNLYAVSD